MSDLNIRSALGLGLGWGFDLQDVEYRDHNVERSTESAIISGVGLDLPISSDWCAKADVCE